ncbi:DUF6894 family protein [Bradyrhizobium sp. DASA03076]|uniref:DUF6894 family protein n=1 Tax=Bradyrhizobium sp. BLXBL-03 TaxID=3395916 RepID=UPI003F6EF0B4
MPDIESARQEATAALSEISRECGRGGPQHRMAVEVRDDRGPVLEATFSFVIEQRLGKCNFGGRLIAGDERNRHISAAEAFVARSP